MIVWKSGIGLVYRLCLLLRILIAVFVQVPQITGDCLFPSTWTGVWFQSEMQHLIKIQLGLMSLKGKCVAKDGDKFLLEDMRSGDCFRCIVIYQRHENVLQYKETDCYPRGTLQTLCSKINGDALLNTMFRVSASPVVCPFRGPFTFTYNRGHDECRSPVSSIDMCSEDFRLLLRYQACPDIPGTESTVEELICLATWKDGPMRYLVGKLEHNMATTDEDKYRCFVYDKYKNGSGYSVAQSGDATCNGLTSAWEGSKIMSLRKGTLPSARCHFPPWLTHGSHWYSLDGRRNFTFGHKNNSFLLVDPAGAVSDTRGLCMEEMTSSDKRTSIVIAAHVTIGCSSGYACFSFTKRWAHVAEVQSGSMVKSLKDACDPQNFDKTTAEFTTLVTPVPERKRCPYVGQYLIPGAYFKPRLTRRDVCDAFSTVKVGCESSDTIEFRYECTTQHHVQAYHCHGNWDENGTSYLITSVKGSKSKYCFIYTETDNVVKFSSFRASCPRNIQPGVGGILAFNFTATADQCHQNDGDVLSRASSSLCPLLLSLSLCLTVLSTLEFFLR